MGASRGEYFYLWVTQAPPPCPGAVGTQAEGLLMTQMLRGHDLQSRRLRQTKIDAILF